VAGLKHQSLFQIYDVTEMDATLVVTVEHLSGLTLRQYVRQKGTVKPEKALTIVRWVAEGLNHVYDKTGLVHLALTPDQIWIDGEGQVKIMGFGFSTIFERIGYSPTDVPFLSPEQVQRQTPGDFQADLYSLGSILYYILTGRVPFEGDSSEQMLEQIVNGQLPAPAGEGVSRALQQLLSRMMMKAPEDRYSGWLPAMQEMDKILDGAKFLPGGKKGALSTILVSAARARETATAIPVTRPPVSSSSLITLFLILAAVLGFWAWAGLTIWRMPPPIVTPDSAIPGPAVIPVETRYATSADQSPASRVRVVRQPRAVESLDDPVVPAESDSAAPEEAGSEAADTNEAGSGPEPVVSNAPPAEAAPEVSAFDTLSDDVVRHLVAGTPALAVAAVDEVVGKNQIDLRGVRLDELRQLAVRGGDPAVLALAVLKQQVGATVKLPVNGHTADVTINRIEGQSAIVIERVQSGETTVKKYYTLEPARMGLGDQVRVLSLGVGPEFAVARILVYLKGGARDRALAASPEAGLLAPAFQRFLSEPAP
jgi:hypothetical protein